MSDAGEVVLELRTSEGGWQKLGARSAIEQPGSISACEGHRRQVYVFGWLPTGDGPGVWRSKAGMDTEFAATRVVSTLGFEQLADLIAGPHEMDWHRCASRAVARLRLRWSVEELV